jgi:hypothetical protein
MRARLVLTVTLVVCSVALGSDQNHHDGTWWSRQSAGFRLYYVLGFMDGMDLGNAFSVPDKSVSANRKAPDSVTDARRTYRERIEQYVAHVTVGQVSDGLDTFYRDSRNRSVLLRDAFEIVLRSIKGEDVEKMIQARRSVAAGK